MTVNPDNTINYDPGALFQTLAVGETATDTVTYTVDDGNGGAVQETVTMTITGVNDAPRVAGPIEVTASEDDAGFSVDLLADAADIDASDTLSVANLQVTGDDSGVTSNGNSLTVDPSAYNGLAVGESATIDYTYDVIDGNGGSVGQQATITINGVNDAPVLTAGTATGAVSEDGTLTASGDLNASDADLSDTLSWSITGDNDADGTVSGAYGSLSLDAVTGEWSYSLNNGSAAVQNLDSDDTVTDVFDVVVSDGNGGSASQSVSINVTGEDDQVAQVMDFNASSHFGYAEDGMYVDTNASWAHYHMHGSYMQVHSAYNYGIYFQKQDGSTFDALSVDMLFGTDGWWWASNGANIYYNGVSDLQFNGAFDDVSWIRFTSNGEGYIDNFEWA